VLRPLRFRDQLVDRLCRKDLPGQRARSCLGEELVRGISTAHAIQILSETAIIPESGALHQARQRS
jgi:hypothetical protein